MKATQPLIFSALILAALSMPQTDAFARFEHHSEHQGGDFAAAKDFNRSDASKFHTVLKHPEEITAGDVKSELKEKGPEIVTLGGAHGIVHEGDVGAAHPESLSKTECSTRKPSGCG
ncbi:MAG: hypothetical protein K2X02_05640 [Alphaproteobacteria bacterium]|nr:hypothetical protein [Alphaproteobacteria bacterium]